MTTARLADSAVWLSAMLIVSPVSGSLTVFTDHAAWDVAAGSATAIDFTGWETGTIITTQYEALGVTFIGADDFIWNNPALFPSDGSGLKGGYLPDFTPLPIVLEFDAPRSAIAANFKGSMGFELYLGGELIGASPPFSSVLQGSFCGVTSTVAFDSVVITGPGNGIPNLDNLFFGPAIPAPATTLLVAALGFVLPRRRRRGSLRDDSTVEHL